MSKYFQVVEERRYAQFKRRYLSEYFFDSRRRIDAPNVSIGYATLASARQKATRAIDQFQCTTVRIFDRKTGQYVFTYKNSVTGILRHDGCVR